MQASSVIAIFAKSPRPGHVKTRLQILISPLQAAALHRACLEDTATLVRAVPGCEKWLLVAGTPQEASALKRDLQLPQEWKCGAQHGRDLGARLHNALQRFFTAGAAKVVIVGADTPWMGRRRIQQALRALDSADVVLGPAADGGYYLVAARRLLPSMFDGIPWGRAGVFSATLLALGKARVRYRLLPRDFDLDRPEDLARAANLLREQSERAPALAQWIQQFVNQAVREKKEASGSTRRPAPARPHKKRRPVRA
jgi:uncharacterized protein